MINRSSTGQLEENGLWMLGGGENASKLSDLRKREDRETIEDRSGSNFKKSRHIWAVSPNNPQ